MHAFPQGLLALVAGEPAPLAHGEEVQLGGIVSRRLIERMLDHDVGVLGEIDPDDDAVAPNARRTDGVRRAHDVPGHAKQGRLMMWGHAARFVHLACRG